MNLEPRKVCCNGIFFIFDIKDLKIYIDEAGRGPLAGPMYVGLVLVFKKFKKSEFKDSKILTEKQREESLSHIQKLQDQNKCLFVTWIATNKEIDKFWISNSLALAIARWLKDLLKIYYQKYILNTTTLCSCDMMDKIILDNFLNAKELKIEEYKTLLNKLEQFTGKIELIIDWNRDFWLRKLFDLSVKTIIDGDQKEPYISMASIIAKVSRDHEMVELSKKYPKYWLEKHKGYWTKFHYKQIEKHWPSYIHRKLFLRKLEWNTEKSIFKKLEHIN